MRKVFIFWELKPVHCNQTQSSGSLSGSSAVPGSFSQHKKLHKLQRSEPDCSRSRGLELGKGPGASCRSRPFERLRREQNPGFQPRSCSLLPGRSSTRPRRVLSPRRDAWSSGTASCPLSALRRAGAAQHPAPSPGDPQVLQTLLCGRTPVRTPQPKAFRTTLSHHGKADGFYLPSFVTTDGAGAGSTAI